MLLGLLFAPIAANAEAPVPLLDTILPGHVAPLRFGAIVSVEGSFGNDEATRRGGDGFDVPEARLSIRGELERGFSYFVQADFVLSPPLLDAEIHWRHDVAGFRARAGYFRVPVSGELQIPLPALDVSDRSQIVDAVAPGRHVGLEIDQELAGQSLVARAGIFNGNGFDANDDDRFLYTLRFDGVRTVGVDSNGKGWDLEYGLSGAYSKDRNAKLGRDLPTNFRGTRILGGLDFRVTRGPVFVSFEGLYASIDESTRTRRDVYGGQATIGWLVLPKVQLLARYDAFVGGGIVSDLDWAIASVNFDLTPYVQLQPEIRVPTRGASPTPGAIIGLSVQF